MNEKETLVVANHGKWDCKTNPQAKLVVRAILGLEDGTKRNILALVDTGAEVNLLRKGLVPQQYFRKSHQPKRFVTASREVLEGGKEEVPCNILFDGVDVDTRIHTEVKGPIVFYDANIGVDALLSYGWLQSCDIEVHCRKHGLQVNGPEGPRWIPGVIRSTCTGILQHGINAVHGNSHPQVGGKRKSGRTTVRVRPCV